MNRFFSMEPESPEPPRHAYARLDQAEPPLPWEGEEAVFAYHGVDAEWRGFDANESMDLGDPQALDELSRALWERAPFQTLEPARQDSPFDRVPLFRFEITLRRDEDLFHHLLKLADQWIEVSLGPTGETPVDVFAGLFVAVPTVTYLASWPTPAGPAAGLRAAFDMDSFPDAAQGDIEDLLVMSSEADRLAIYDVGQGSASALLCSGDRPLVYFDLGCGVYRNAPTSPPQGLVFCECGNPPILLSHWDSDHWAGARRDPRALGATWVAPRQKLDPVHKTFAADILANGGRLLIVPRSIPPPTYSGSTPSGQILSLRRSTGSDRNGSGMALFVEDPVSGLAWLLTGDAAYNHIQGPWPQDFAAIVVPHHGANMGVASVPPLRNANSSYARLLYSFGPDNQHGRTNVRHPTDAAVNVHAGSGWNHGSWTVPNAGYSIAGGDTLATAQHLLTHLDGAIAGWAAAPTLPTTCRRCSATIDVNQR